MPENTVYVGRPTKWGNPYPADKSCDRKLAALRYQFHLGLAVTAHQEGEKTSNEHFMRIAENMHVLKGKNLACWCPLDCDCHADVLLKLVNDL